MPKRSCGQTRLTHKILLIAAGFLLSLIILEIGMHSAEKIIIGIQDAHNRISILKKHSCVILCVGESTTQYQYPRFLKEYFGNKITNINFSVIDKGLIGTNSDEIISKIDNFINQFHPDIIVAMMGINDTGNIIPYEQRPADKFISALRSLKTFKLFMMIKIHIKNKIKEAEEKRLINILNQRNTGIINHPKEVMPELNINNITDVKILIEQGLKYFNEKKLSKAGRCFNKVLDIPHDNMEACEAYIGLGNIYRCIADYNHSEACFKKAIELNPSNAWAYLGICWLYIETDSLELAEKYLKELLKLYPQHELGLIALSWVYSDMHRDELALEYLKKATDLYPHNNKALLELAGKLILREEYASAKEYGNKIQGLSNEVDYLLLGSIYQETGDEARARKCANEIINLFPESDLPYSFKSGLYRQSGELDLADEYSGKAERIRINGYKLMTIKNFRRLKETADKNKIRLVIVQYPMRKIDSLIKMFETNADRVIFVDNQKIFNDAVSKEGYKTYFTDRFAGDFGHCTEKGNRLLANNISDTIIKEYFKRKD
jgi:tetratricopeptide (TPR) repeat protein